MLGGALQVEPVPDGLRCPKSTGISAVPSVFQFRKLFPVVGGEGSFETAEAKSGKIMLEVIGPTARGEPWFADEIGKTPILLVKTPPTPASASARH